MKKQHKLAVCDADELQSQTINYLRFPLIVAVVMIHATLSDMAVQRSNMLDTSALDIYPIVSYTLSSLLSSVAVPLFLLISGFLFFHTPSQFNRYTYITKLQKRAKSILLPYLFWSLVVLLTLYLSQSLLPQFSSGAHKPISSFRPLDFIASLWSMTLVEPHQQPYPICYQFWFLRDLMISMVASPLIYFFIRRMGLYFIALLIALWVVNLPYLIGLNPMVYTFFSIGAYISITRQNLTRIARKGYKLSIVLFIASGTICHIICSAPMEYLLQCVYTLAGSYAAIAITVRMLERGDVRVNVFLTSSSFFIFAYHGLTIVFVKKLFIKLMAPQSDMAITGVYLLSPIVTIIIGLALYYILKRYLPRFTSLITGGR